MTATAAANSSTGNIVNVRINTNMGAIELELYRDKAPVTVDNFLTYVAGGHYSNTLFHRVIDGFMIQGGGYTPDMAQKATLPPIKNEADNGLTNDRGTISMARRPSKDSATSQFFINLQNNDFLNHGVRDFGYAVFGKVTSGMDVVDAIGKVKTLPGDRPVQPVIVTSVDVLSQ
nr:peptidylprolyl isomerase [Oceanobacter mangrovi]